jgi:hypothetical protein
VCGILWLLLIVVWIRSYWWVDLATVPVASNTIVGIGVEIGALAVATAKANVSAYDPWTITTTAVADIPSVRRNKPTTRTWLWKVAKGRFRCDVANTTACAPFWFLITVVTALGMTPWLRWRVSLRTLLIAMTVVAVLLGAVVWLAK